MDDNSWLERLVLEVLPAMVGDRLLLVLTTLSQLGVESPDDLKFLTEKDLADVLPPIKARKLLQVLNGAGTTETHDTDGPTRSEEQSPSTSQPHHSTSQQAETSIHGSVGDWSMKYKIPWDKLPKNLIASCTKDERPAPRDRREMIRIIVDEVMQISTNPKRKELRRVAQQIVGKFRKPFADVINGQIIGDGTSSLLLQLESRKENLLRNSDQQKKRTKQISQEAGTSSGKKSKTHEIDGFGCIKSMWKPSLPEGETEETQEVKKTALHTMYEEVTWKRVEIDDMMAATYCTQRKDIIEADNIQDVLNQWPFLAEERWLFNHFTTLTGIDLIDKLNDDITNKASRLINFLKTKTSPATMVKSIREIQHESKPEIIKSVPKILAAYFKEDETALIRFYDDTANKSTVEGDESLPTTPCIAVIGQLNQKKSFLCVDRKVISVALSSVASGLMMAFSAFYVFNIIYPATASSTLDFIQRLFVGINPSDGSRTTKGRKQCVSTKVINLAAELAIFESDWKQPES